LYTESFPTENCDSVVSLQLTVTTIDSTIINANICEGTTYTFGNQTLSESGTYSQSFSTNSCDSVAILNLTVHQTSEQEVALSICSEQLPIIWNGISVITPGTHVATYTTKSTHRCDSIVHLNLSVAPAATNIHIDTAACGLIVFEEKTYSQSTQWTDTLSNAQGCDSVYRHIQLTVYPQDAEELNINLFGCSSVTFEGKTYFADTIISETFLSVYGCDSQYRSVIIEIENFNLELVPGQDTAYQGETITLTTLGNTPYNVTAWHPAAWFNNQTAVKQYWQAQTSGTIKVEAISKNNCIDSAEIYLDVQPFNSGIFIPNAFSPNGDGLNDYFGPAF